MILTSSPTNYRWSPLTPTGINDPYLQPYKLSLVTTDSHRHRHALYLHPYSLSLVAAIGETETDPSIEAREDRAGIQIVNESVPIYK